MATNKVDALELKFDGAAPAEMIIRQGNAPDLLAPKEPLKIALVGILDSPLRWLQLRQADHADNTCHVVFNREKMTIELVQNEKDFYRTIVKGALELHPLFVKFGINSGKRLTHYEMAQFFKINRHAFESKAVAMGIVHQLQNFRAKIDKEVESQDDKRGNARELRAQAVSHNLPESFNLHIPIFKGMDKVIIAVEVDVDADDLSCTLVSAEANDLIEQMRDEETEKVLSAIADLAPGIVIIEQ